MITNDSGFVMSEEQISALLASLKEISGLKEKLKGATGLDATMAVVDVARFDVIKDD